MSTILMNGTPKRLSVEITRPANALTYAANDAINSKETSAKKKVTITLTGTSGGANVTLAGGLTKAASWVTSLTATAAAFVASHAAAYLAVGIVCTSSGATIILESYDGTDFTTPAITNTSGDLAGTAVVTTAHTGIIEVKKKVTLTLSGSTGTGTISGAGGLTKTVTYATSLTATAAAFVTANAAAYLAKGIVLTSSVADLIFEANVAGVDFTTPVFTEVTGNIAGAAVVTTANITADLFLLNEAAATSGGGGIITDIMLEADDTTNMAAKEIIVHLFSQKPTAIGDGTPFKTLYAEKAKRVMSVTVTMGAALTGATSVVGQASVMKQFQCASTLKSLYVALQHKTGGAAASGKKINVTVFVTQF